MPLAADTKDFCLPINRVTQRQSMSCWHAAASMVLAFRGVALSVVNMSTNLDTVLRYATDGGLPPTDVIKFANEVGLHTQQTVFGTGFGLEDYRAYILTLGPLWLAGNYGQRGHVAVVYGISGSNLAIADPDPGEPFPLWMSLSAVEVVRQSRSLPILYRANAP